MSSTEQRLRRLIEEARKSGIEEPPGTPELPPFFEERVVARWRSESAGPRGLQSWDRPATLGAALAVALAIALQVAVSDRSPRNDRFQEPGGLVDPFTEMAENPDNGITR
jgi:hypothetical protein